MFHCSVICCVLFLNVSTVVVAVSLLCCFFLADPFSPPITGCFNRPWHWIFLEKWQVRGDES